MQIVKVELSLSVRFHKKGNWWISQCPDLDLYSQGHTKSEAKTNLEDALAFFIESCVDRGTVFQVLEEAGFRPAKSGELRTSGRKKTRKSLRIEVPLPFVCRRSRPRAPGVLVSV